MHDSANYYQFIISLVLVYLHKIHVKRQAKKFISNFEKKKCDFCKACDMWCSFI